VGRRRFSAMVEAPSKRRKKPARGPARREEPRVWGRSASRWTGVRKEKEDKPEAVINYFPLRAKELQRKRTNTMKRRPGGNYNRRILSDGCVKKNAFAAALGGKKEMRRVAGRVFDASAEKDVPKKSSACSTQLRGDQKLKRKKKEKGNQKMNLRHKGGPGR